MKWIKNNYYVHQYYKITEEGEQRSMYDSCTEAYILHIHNDGIMKYYFIPPGGSYEMKTPYTVNELSVYGIVCIAYLQKVLCSGEMFFLTDPYYDGCARII
jgi:hypothetical protein